MCFLILRGYLELIRFDLYIARGNFEILYNKVRTCRIGKSREFQLYHPLESSRVTTQDLDLTEQICAAIDLACIWYWREALCLQRSAATACLLKKYGVPAQLTIGAQQMPFRAHAWVEVNGRVVNDKDYIPDVYAVLDRC